MKRSAAEKENDALRRRRMSAGEDDIHFHALCDCLSTLAGNKEKWFSHPFVAVYVFVEGDKEQMALIQETSREARQQALAEAMRDHPPNPPKDPILATLDDHELFRALLGDHHLAILYDEMEEMKKLSSRPPEGV